MSGLLKHINGNGTCQILIASKSTILMSVQVIQKIFDQCKSRVRILVLSKHMSNRELSRLSILLMIHYGKNLKQHIMASVLKQHIMASIPVHLEQHIMVSMPVNFKQHITASMPINVETTFGQSKTAHQFTKVIKNMNLQMCVTFLRIIK